MVPIRGRTRLIDSNLDWGQDLWAVREYLQQHQIEDVGLLISEWFPQLLKELNIIYQPQLPSQGCTSSVSTSVQGRPHYIRQPNGEIYHASLDDFGYFRFFKPIAHLGTSIDVYNITPEDIAIWQRLKK